MRNGERCELLALDVFFRGRDSGAVITVAVVVDRLRDLRSHRGSCRCGRCEWVRRWVSAAAVYGVLAGWLEVDPCAVPLEPPVDPYGSHSCAQCGELFAARRFDARFCSAACRPSSMTGSR